MSRAQLVIVGAGSAGCVVASRLAREFGIRVALVEAPSSEAPAIQRTRPASWLQQLGSGDDWSYKTQPNDHLAGRWMTWPRGRGLGGSSRINAMIWFPPTLADRTRLREASGGRWSITELESAYQSLESIVCSESPRWLSEPSRQFVEAVRDFPAATPMVYRRLNRRGRRWLPSELLPTGKDRVEILRGVVDRLIWDGDNAAGVHVQGEQGSFELPASHGVILAAGTIATPLILMRSGVGDRDELARHKIELRVERPAVGKRLRDHLIMPVVYEREASCKPFLARSTMRDLTRWDVMGTGPIASNLAECGGLFEDRSLQLHVTPTHYLTYPMQDAVASMTIGVNLTQPESTGRVRLTSKRPCDEGLIEAGYLERESDLEETIRGVRLCREIAQRPPLCDSIRRESLPGTKRSGNDEIARAITRYAQTLYHPVGSCRMGEDADSVIDHDFAVRGGKRLWIVDASILPNLTLGNPNATVMTLAWMAAERIARQV